MPTCCRRHQSIGGSLGAKAIPLPRTGPCCCHAGLAVPGSSISSWAALLAVDEHTPAPCSSCRSQARSGAPCRLSLGASGAGQPPPAQASIAPSLPTRTNVHASGRKSCFNFTSINVCSKKASAPKEVVSTYRFKKVSGLTFEFHLQCACNFILVYKKNQAWNPSSQLHQAKIIENLVVI